MSVIDNGVDNFKSDTLKSSINTGKTIIDAGKDIVNEFRGNETDVK